MERKIAVSAGYYFGIIEESKTKGIELVLAFQKGYILKDNQEYQLYRGKTFDDSRKIDHILDGISEFKISDYYVECLVEEIESDIDLGV